MSCCGLNNKKTLVININLISRYLNRYKKRFTNILKTIGGINIKIAIDGYSASWTAQNMVFIIFWYCEPFWFKLEENTSCVHFNTNNLILIKIL